MDLKRNTNSIHGDKFDCDICDKQFSRQELLIKHKQTIHGSGLDCQECDK